MISQQIVVVGGVAAGMSAASKAKRLNPALDIIAFEQSGYVSYGSCGLPYLISGKVAQASDLVVRTPQQFARHGIRALVHHEVTQIDTASQTVVVRDRSERSGSHNGAREFVQPYDQLIVTTGGAAARPLLDGADRSGIFTLRTIEDAQAIQSWIAEHQPHRAVVVGGGYIGLEMAEAFRTLGLDVAIVEMLPQVLPNLDAEMAALVREELERQQVRLHLGHALEGFDGDTQVRAVYAGGEDILADMVLLGLGVRANSTLARTAGIRLGPTGAIAVTPRMETNVPNVYAAGDVAEVQHLVTRQPAYIPLGTTANKQGRVAGENAAGGDAHFDGVVGTAVVKVFGLEVARTGLTEAEADRAGLTAASVRIQQPAIAHYLPGHTSLDVKLVWEKASGRLLGAQIVGAQGAAKRIDVVAALLQTGGSVDNLARLDLSYAPPYAPVWDPLLVAANAALKE